MGMVLFAREVVDPVLIAEILKMMDTVHVGMNDEDGFPYVVPLNFGFEMDESQLRIYIHSPRPGKKCELFRRDPRVCCTFSAFNDFPDRKWKGFRHDFRSVIAKGTIRLVTRDEDPEAWMRGYELMYTCNNREIKPLSEWKSIPNIYMGIITCDMADVTAKSEMPLRTVEDVPFINVYEQPDDDEPFDISDIIADRRARRQRMEAEAAARGE